MGGEIDHQANASGAIGMESPYQVKTGVHDLLLGGASIVLSVLH